MPDSPILTGGGKKKFVRDMFDAIAPRYDLLNRLLSGGIDQAWRRKAIGMLETDQPDNILDVATGTADLAIMATRLGPRRIVGVDIAEEMLEIGRQKIGRSGLTELIELRFGDAENLPFPDNEFDAALVAFGVRNFENLSLGLSEIARVLKPGAQLVVLEFSRPKRFPIRQIYTVYGQYILPLIGKMVSGDDQAYTYLPESIQVFPDGEHFLDVLRSVGFNQLSVERLTYGIASIYTGRAT